MKKFYFYFTCCSFGFLSVFCGRMNNTESITVAKNSSENTSIKTQENSNLLSSSGYDLGQGYNSMSVQFTPPCTSGETISIPQSVAQAVVTFQNDQTEEELRNQLNIKLSATIPIQGIVNLTPELQYARDAGQTRLTHTTTYEVYIQLGNKTLIPNAPQILSNYNSDFDAQGNLINSSDFINQCGDEIVTSQKLSSKLLITAKINFQSTSDLNTFNGTLGVAPTVAPNWTINAQIKDIDSAIRQRMSMTIYAIQLGGSPIHLVNTLTGSSSCTLDNLPACQAVLNQLNSYVTQNYPNQLHAANINDWNIESVTSEPYANLRIKNQNGQPLNFNVTSGYNNLQKLSEIENYVSAKIFSEMTNYLLANTMLQSNYLATNETATLNTIITNANQNMQNLRLFAQTCYNNVTQCLTDYNAIFINTITVSYDTGILQTNIGARIASVYSAINKYSYLNTRSSDNFIALNPNLKNGLYSSYYFKFKTLDNKLISNPSATVSIMCDFQYWFPGTLLTGVFSKYEIMNNAFELNYSQYCSDKFPIYVANPSGFASLVGNSGQFIVELWGRN